MVLSVQALSVRRGGSTVLDNIDLELRPAELVALIGANGSGKTTLLRALSGTIDPSGGAVVLLGQDVTHAAAEAAVRGGLAHVPEGRRLFEGLTVRENLILGGWRTRTDDIEPALSILPELIPLLGQRAGTLSGAHAQLCAVGRALVADPAVLLIDEISLGLAPQAIARLLMLLPDLASLGVSVLFIEQDVGRALSIADRVYLLDRGHVARSGQPGELLADPDFVRLHVNGLF
ncbi:ATP-binding cassette domain-containing protein [Dermatophilaceae bacterium Sec6.4]